MISAIIITSSATSDKTAYNLTKNLTKTLRNSEEKNHRGDIYGRDIRTENQVIHKQHQTEPTKPQKIKQGIKTTPISSLLLPKLSDSHLK